MTDEQKQPESPIEEKELNETEVGDIDQVTGLKIIYIIYSSTDFIVDLDEKMSLNWMTNTDYSGYATDFGEVVGSVGLSEALVDRIFSDGENRMDYKKMLGSVIGRILDDKNSVGARKLLAIVDERINEHGREKVRMNYIYASIATVLVVGMLLAAVVLFHPYLKNIFPDPERYRVVLSILLGGIGAYITTFARFNNYKGSLVAGIPIHRLDGFLRIFYGLIAGLIIYLAVKANILMGFANDNNKDIPWLYYFIAMVAGASEVLIPNLIKQAEGELGIKKLEKKEEEIKDEIKDKKKDADEEKKREKEDEKEKSEASGDEKNNRPVMN